MRNTSAQYPHARGAKGGPRGSQGASQGAPKVPQGGPKGQMGPETGNISGLRTDVWRFTSNGGSEARYDLRNWTSRPKFLNHSFLNYSLRCTFSRNSDKRQGLLFWLPNLYFSTPHRWFPLADGSPTYICIYIYI